MTSTTAPTTAPRHTARDTTAAQAPQATPPALTPEQRDARATRQLALIAAAGILIVLVTFLAMMWIISGASGPRV